MADNTTNRDVVDLLERTRQATGYDTHGPRQYVASKLGITPEQVKWAKSLQDRYPIEEELGGRRDAARHLGLGYLAARSEYPRLAEIALKLDESRYNPLNIGAPEEREQDDINNMLGYAIQAKTPAEAEKIIHQMIRDKKAVSYTPEESRRLFGYENGGEVGLEEEIPERYKGLTEAELLARKASEDFADIELQFEMAPYFGYTSPIDASAVKVHPEPRDRVDYDPYLRGWYIPKSAAPKIEKLKERGITELDGYPAEAGTVNVVLPHGEHKYFFPTSIDEDTRQTLAHEFRHKRVHETPGRSSLKYQIGENEVRFLDVLTAQNEREYNAARRSYESTPLGIGVTPGNVRHKLESRTNFYKDLQKALNVDASGRMADGAYSPVVEYFMDEMAQDIRERNDPSNYAFFGSEDVNDPLASWIPPRDNVFRYINKRLSQGYYAKMNKALKEERKAMLPNQEVAEPPFEVKINRIDLPQNKANGGEVEYEYGVRPEAGSEVFDFILPYRREVITPPEEKVYMSDDPDAPVVYERIPGEYGEPELSFPFPVQAAIEGAPKVYDALRNWKGVLRSQEDRDKVRRAASAIQQGVGGFAKYIGAAGRAAQAQQEYAYDPELGLIDSSDFTLALSTPLAPGLLPQKVSPSVLNMMAGIKAKNAPKEKIAEAAAKIRRGVPDEEVFEQTGQLRLLEDKLGTIIPLDNFKIDDKALNAKVKMRKDFESDLPQKVRAGKVKDFIDWPEGFAAYPELKNLKITYTDDSKKFAPKSDVFLEGGTIFLKRSPYSSDVSKKVLTRDILSALQSHISAKEGFVQPVSTQAPDTDLANIKEAIRNQEKFLKEQYEPGRFLSRAAIKRQGTESPKINVDDFKDLAEMQAREQALIASTPDIGTLRDPANSLGLGYHISQMQEAQDDEFSTILGGSPEKFKKAKDEYLKKLIDAYTQPDYFDRYPLNFGQLLGDVPVNENIGAYESPVLMVLRGMKDQKQPLDQLLNKIKSTATKKGIKGVTSEALQPLSRIGVSDEAYELSRDLPEEDLIEVLKEAFDEKTRVTPSEVARYIEKNSVPIRETFRSSDKQNVDYNMPDSKYVTQARQPSGNADYDRNMLVEPPKNLKLLTLSTETDPLSGIPFKDDHYKLAENTFAHIRYNDRVLADENDNLFDALYVEEIQADWHQKATDFEKRLILEFVRQRNTEDVLGMSGDRFINKARKNIGPNTFGGAWIDGAPNRYTQNNAREAYKKAVDNEVVRMFRKEAPEVAKLFKESAYRINNHRWFNPRGWVGKYFREDPMRVIPEPVPDAPFKNNWMQLGFDRMVQEASVNNKDGLAFTPDLIQNIRYKDEVVGVDFKFYDSLVKNHAKEIAKKYGVELKKLEIPQRNMDTFEPTEGHMVWYLPLTEKMKDDFTQKPLSKFQSGGGVSSLASVARDMNHRPRGMASLSQIARNMYSGAVA